MRNIGRYGTIPPNQGGILGRTFETSDGKASHFSLGNVVKLKSGGIPMVVHNLKHDTHVGAMWHDADGKVQTEYFLPEVLMPAEGHEVAAG